MSVEGPGADHGAAEDSAPSQPGAFTDPRQKFRIVLSALVTGCEVRLDGNLYRLFLKGETVETLTQSGELTRDQLMMQVMANPGTAHEMKSWVGAEYPLEWLLGAARNLSEAEIVQIAATTALNRGRREQANRSTYRP